MCGICGLAGSPDRERLAAMSAALEHRGPDNAGEFVEGPVALASRGRSIIDLAGGDQPFFNEDESRVVVQNGEIYNHPELMRELLRDGHTYRTHSDTETIVHLYEQHGLGFAEKLRGMFAIAIWDARERRLVLARDRYGIKPLYYRHVAGQLPFDSALLAALAAQETSEAVHTFTIGFAERSFDEREDARRVAERYATNHHELLLHPDPTLLLPALADAFDEPFADSSALPTYLVSQLASRHVKVALSGEGGDELFGGYYTYAADMLADRVAPLARLARPLVERLPASTAKASFDYKAKRFVRAAHLPPLERHHGWKEIFSPDARAALQGRTATFDPVDVYRERYRETEGADPLARLQDVDFGIYLVDDLLVKTDRASMAHSLEARVPFLGPHVTNSARPLPT